MTVDEKNEHYHYLTAVINDFKIKKKNIRIENITTAIILKIYDILSLFAVEKISCHNDHKPRCNGPI